MPLGATPPLPSVLLDLGTPPRPAPQPRRLLQGSPTARTAGLRVCPEVATDGPTHQPGDCGGSAHPAGPQPASAASCSLRARPRQEASLGAGAGACDAGQGRTGPRFPRQPPGTLRRARSRATRRHQAPSGDTGSEEAETAAGRRRAQAPARRSAGPRPPQERPSVAALPAPRFLPGGAPSTSRGLGVARPASPRGRPRRPGPARSPGPTPPGLSVPAGPPRLRRRDHGAPRGSPAGAARSRPSSSGRSTVRAAATPRPWPPPPPPRRPPPTRRPPPAAGRLLLPRRPTRPRTLTPGTHDVGRLARRAEARATVAAEGQTRPRSPAIRAPGSGRGLRGGAREARGGAALPHLCPLRPHSPVPGPALSPQCLLGPEAPQARSRLLASAPPVPREPAPSLHTSAGQRLLAHVFRTPHP